MNKIAATYFSAGGETAKLVRIFAPALSADLHVKSAPTQPRILPTRGREPGRRPPET